MVDIITTASWSWSPSISLLHGCDHHYCCYFVVVITISIISWSWLPSLLLLHGHGRHRYYYFLIMVTIITVTSWSWSPSLLLFHGRGCLLPSLLLLLLLRQGIFPYPILCKCGVSDVEHEVALASTTFT
jgi:hypothetical protein